MTDEQLGSVLGRLWVAALAAASGFDGRAHAVVESAAAQLATLHGGTVLDWHPPLPPAAEPAAHRAAKG